MAFESDSTGSTNLHILLRGPIIIILSLSTLILPHVLSISSQNLILSISAFLGIFLTLTDISTIFHSHWNQLLIKAKVYSDNLIIDDVLKDMFGAEGWVTCLWGSWIGTLILYFLPLSKEVRLKIIESMWGEDDNDYVNKILFQPGGIRRIVSDLCPPPEEGPHIPHDIPVSVVEGDLEMTWDGDTDSNNDNEHLTIETATSIEDGQQQQHCQHEQRMAPNNQKGTVEKESEKDTIEHIFIQSLLKISTAALEHLDETKLQRLGTGAAAVFFLQMRFSPAARRTIWNTVQSSASLGLATVAIGALSSAQLKKNVMHWVNTGTATAAAIHNSIPRSVPSNQGRGSRTSSNYSGGVGGGIDLIKNLTESLLRRFRVDTKFKRKWQTLAALMVLYYFKQKRTRNLPMSRNRR